MTYGGVGMTYGEVGMIRGIKTNNIYLQMGKTCKICGKKAP